jgi:DNA-binding PadR family transcriptional regulator
MSERRPPGRREFEILVALIDGPKHGYGIMSGLREANGGRGVLGPGTLYRVLKQLEARGLVAVASSGDDESEGPPRRYYRLTTLGRRIVAGEARRLADLLQRTRALLELPRQPERG